MMALGDAAVAVLAHDGGKDLVGADELCPLCVCVCVCKRVREGRLGRGL